MISKEQERSDFALKQLKNIAIEEEFANFIVSIPSMILQNGLAQTMAFLLSKCKGIEDNSNKYYLVFKIIASWSYRVNNNVPFNDSLQFFEIISNLEQDKYLSLQEEALKMLQWLKRYARAFQKEV